ncbi:sensor histidine kinase [Phaeodactylibacter sp.]|jgi:signal transduction histidine kinase|uniref:sensor histidine kinase n=1 Tax=Phaeodactylibacter sp. TaxID=1940289 RepID=UPI0025DB7506|nr:sensor histidine kinase [Phaeodactylibacter sp.]MCI4648915.1 sensor histidine kinase [Phaeodactylibacter sp.]MCI5092649.1 sensor histidine kinase [Phaeodactylibacter sp.]
MDTTPAQTEILTTIFIGIFLMLLLALAFVLFFYFSQRKFQVQQILAQEREIKHREQLLLASIKTQEEERQRLARELHDEVGSKLNVINLGLHQLKKQGAAPEAQQSFKDLFGLVRKTTETTRRIAHDLLPPTLEKFGLPMALEELCDQYRQSSPVMLEYEFSESGSQLDALVALNFFRVAQELLSNAYKYSQATAIKITLHLKPNALELTYQDNGIGFDPNARGQQKGMGLKNIESRMRTIRADYRLDSAPGRGTAFTAQKTWS